MTFMPSYQVLILLVFLFGIFLLFCFNIKNILIKIITWDISVDKKILGWLVKNEKLNTKEMKE